MSNKYVGLYLLIFFAILAIVFGALVTATRQTWEMPIENEQFVSGELRLKELIVYTKNREESVQVHFQSNCYIGIEGQGSANSYWVIEAKDHQSIKILNPGHCQIKWLVLTENNVTMVTTKVGTSTTETLMDFGKYTWVITRMWLVYLSAWVISIYLSSLLFHEPNKEPESNDDPKTDDTQLTETVNTDPD